MTKNKFFLLFDKHQLTVMASNTFGKKQFPVSEYPLNGSSTSKKNEIEIELWERFRNGDKDALVSIYKKFQKPLTNYAFQFTKDRELIKDCIHELFVSLFAKNVNPGNTTSVRFYLFRSLRRLLAREATKKKKFLRDKKEYFEDSSFQISLSQESVIIEQEQNKWQLWQLHRAVNKLPIRQREAIFYFFFEGFSYKEITEIMDFKEVKTSRTLIYRALNTLREDMDLKGGKEPDILVILFLLTQNFCLGQKLTNIENFPNLL